MTIYTCKKKNDIDKLKLPTIYYIYILKFPSCACLIDGIFSLLLQK